MKTLSLTYLLCRARCLLFLLWGAFFSGYVSNAQNFIATGSYTGDGTDNRAITGVGFKPDVILIKGNTTKDMILRTNSMAGDVSKKFHAGTQMTNCVQQVLPDGFEVGSDACVNSNGVTYYWACMKNQNNDFTSGSYTGNATDNRAITGLGFQPDYVFVFSNAGDHGAFTTVNMGANSSCDVGNSCSQAGVIKSLNADGFTIGTNAMVNSNASVYYWFAGKSHGGAMGLGTFTGNASDNRNLSITNFTPSMIWVKQDGNGNGVFRFSSVAGDKTLTIDASNPSTNMIQAINSDGFQAGTDALVNSNGTTYYYIAFNDPGTPLQLEWVSFDVVPLSNGTLQANWVVNQWNTLNEFVLERSLDGDHFTEIAHKSVADFKGPGQYSDNIDLPFKGEAWYRVSALKSDGTKSYSEKVKASSEISASLTPSFSIYPNPVADQKIQIEFNLPVSLPVELYMLDLSGKEVNNWQFPGTGTVKTFYLDFPSELNPGLYFIEARGSGFRSVKGLEHIR